MKLNSIALDVHAHLVPVMPDRLNEIDAVELVDGKLRIDGHLLGIEAIYHPEELVDWADANKVDRILVSAPPPLYRSHLDKVAAREWSIYINDGLFSMCETGTDRLLPLPHLPIEHPDVAADMLRRYATSPKALFGVSIGVGGATSLVLSDPVYEPLWKSLNDLGSFAILHPGACCDGRLKDFYLENLLGNPYETTVAVSHLIFAGVLERYPAIRFCLAHGGGCAATLAGRWQRGVDTNRPGVNNKVENPRQALQRFYVDCILHDAATLEYAASVFGDNQLLFGSDWPFPMGLPQPHEQLADVSQALRDKIFETNPKSLLGGN